MSVLIRGMEMPTACSMCPLHSEDYKGVERCDIGWKKLPKAGEKPGWCPLVPVPPHGRLIDADALEQEFKKLVYQDNWYYNSLHHAPTIIPAEEADHA